MKSYIQILGLALLVAGVAGCGNSESRDKIDYGPSSTFIYSGADYNQQGMSSWNSLLTEEEKEAMPLPLHLKYNHPISGGDTVRFDAGMKHFLSDSFVRVRYPRGNGLKDGEATFVDSDLDGRLEFIRIVGYRSSEGFEDGKMLFFVIQNENEVVISALPIVTSEYLEEASDLFRELYPIYQDFLHAVVSNDQDGLFEDYGTAVKAYALTLEGKDLIDVQENLVRSAKNNVFPPLIDSSEVDTWLDSVEFSSSTEWGRADRPKQPSGRTLEYIDSGNYWSYSETAERVTLSVKPTVPMVGPTATNPVSEYHHINHNLDTGTFDYVYQKTTVENGEPRVDEKIRESGLSLKDLRAKGREDEDYDFAINGIKDFVKDHRAHFRYLEAHKDDPIPEFTIPNPFRN